MRSSDLTVLVTGANGFIGRHLILELLNRGYAVIAGVREASNVQRIQDLPVEIVRLNYLDQDSLRDKLQETRPDFIIHNAGSTVGKKETDYFLGNTESTRNLLKASTEIGLSKFVYISSLAARGPGKNPQDSPVSPYGKSKLEAETAVRLSGIDFTIIRPTAVYGPGDSAFDPIFAWANRGVILQLGSASRKLTFIHVSDLSRIIADSLHSGEVLHYGWDGRNYIQRDLTNALRKVTGKRGVVLSLPSWVFRTATSFMDFFVRKIGRSFWLYPPWKVIELIADDWSILDAEKPQNCQYTIESGFEQTYTYWKKA